MLALALLCQDEDEVEAAIDYVAAARHKLGEADDKRAELFTLQTHSIMLLGQGRAKEAAALLGGALVLAEEMGDQGLAARCLTNLSVAHRSSLDLSSANIYAERAIGLARGRGDLHFLGTALLAVGHAQRLEGAHAVARAALAEACAVAEGLGYAHLLSAALSQLALTELQMGPGPSPQLANACVHKLTRACAISEANGLRRATCDDLYNWNAAVLQCGHGGNDAREAAFAGLDRAAQLAKEISYTSTRARALLTIGLGRLRTCRCVDKSAVPWPCQADEVERAGESIAEAAALLAKRGTSAEQVQLHGHLAYLRMARAECAPSAEVATALRLEALRHALLAFDLESGRAGGRLRSATLTNLGIAMLVAGRPRPNSTLLDARAAASAAIGHLKAAVVICESADDVAQRRRALVALAGAHEELGAAADAAVALREAAGLVAEPDGPAISAQGVRALRGAAA